MGGQATAALLCRQPAGPQEGAEHSHSSGVTSVGIEAEGALSFPRVQQWLSTLLQVGGRSRGAHGLARKRVGCHRDGSRTRRRHRSVLCSPHAHPCTLPLSRHPPLPQEKGADIYRSKGILCMEGSEHK